MNTPIFIPTVNIAELIRLQEKPELFTPGNSKFWTDPYIAKQMLKAHLDSSTEAASRPPEMIGKIIDWVIERMDLRLGDCVLDLGCGPGLYTSRLAQRGLKVTGVDYSQSSISYATKCAKEEGLSIDYRCQDYLTLADSNQYDLVLLIYGDFCTFSPESRRRILTNIHHALRPGGAFIFDVSTPFLRQRVGEKNGWYAEEQGFWKPGKHLVLKQGFAYENDIFLDQYIVIEENGKISLYRNWFQDYTVDAIRKELEVNTFLLENYWGGLAGEMWLKNSEWIGVVARKK